MIQDLIVYGLVLLALSFVLMRVIKIFTSQNKNHCGDCPACELKKEVKKR